MKPITGACESRENAERDVGIGTREAATLKQTTEKTHENQLGMESTLVNRKTSKIPYNTTCKRSSHHCTRR